MRRSGTPDEHFAATPRALTRTVVDFCESVVAKARPEYVPVEPVEFAEPRECFRTVDRQVGNEDGSRVLGWKIWEYPGVYIEAEFHACWRAPTGRLVDVMPSDPDIRTLFVQDPLARWEGVRVDNIRRALLGDPLVHRFIRCKERHFEVFGDLPAGSYDVPTELAQQVQLSEEEGQQFAELVMARRGRNDPCPCGSGKKYKKCHAPQ